MSNNKKITVCLLTCISIVLCIGVFAVAGCKKKDGDNKVIFTTGLGKDEVFRIGDSICTVPEMMIYLTNTQNQYENVYGEEIWNTSLNGVTLEQNVKDTVLEKLAQIKTMYLLAKSKNITLTKEEEERVDEAAESYIKTLNEKEKQLLKADKATVSNLYKEYLMAGKVYQEIIKDINPEISDDEARTITVQHILFRTYTRDKAGNKVEYSDEQRREKFVLASEVQKKAIESPSEFAQLAAEYSDDSNLTYSFGKGELDPSFEEAAFLLETDEISNVIASESGYHIIKCISTFNKEETDTNKVKIVEKRRNEAFGREYDLFEQTLARKLNEDVWNDIVLIREKEVVTDRFFEVFNSYFDMQK